MGRFGIRGPVSVQQINDGARCRPKDWPLFVSDDEEDQGKAKMLCAVCPVRDMCLVEHWFNQDTVIGGTTWRERRDMLSDGTYPSAVGRQLDVMFSSMSGMYRISGIGLTYDEALKLRWRHAPETVRTR